MPLLFVRVASLYTELLSTILRNYSSVGLLADFANATVLYIAFSGGI